MLPAASMIGVGDLGERVIDHVADVEHLADRRVAVAASKRLDDVVDVQAVAALRAVAEDLIGSPSNALRKKTGRKPSSSLVSRWRGP